MLGAIIGSAIGAGASLWGNKQNVDMQKQFAKKGIQWKVADSLKAGIHPLYGLGAQTMSFTPTNVGGELSQIASNMGQDIDRSRAATAEAPMRGAMAKLALERANLENDLLKGQIAEQVQKLHAPAVGPGMPAVDGGVKLVPPQRTTDLRTGGKVTTNPYVTDAQTIEDRYGDSEILSMLSALGIGAADLYWNLYRPGIGKVRPSRNPNLIGRR